MFAFYTGVCRRKLLSSSSGAGDTFFFKKNNPNKKNQDSDFRFQISNFKFKITGSGIGLVCTSRRYVRTEMLAVHRTILPVRVLWRENCEHQMPFSLVVGV